MTVTIPLLINENSIVQMQNLGVRDIGNMLNIHLVDAQIRWRKAFAISGTAAQEYNRLGIKNEGRYTRKNANECLKRGARVVELEQLAKIANVNVDVKLPDNASVPMKVANALGLIGGPRTFDGHGAILFIDSAGETGDNAHSALVIHADPQEGVDQILNTETNRPVKLDKVGWMKLLIDEAAFRDVAVKLKPKAMLKETKADAIPTIDKIASYLIDLDGTRVEREGNIQQLMQSPEYAKEFFQKVFEAEREIIAEYGVNYAKILRPGELPERIIDRMVETGMDTGLIAGVFLDLKRNPNGIMAKYGGNDSPSDDVPKGRLKGYFSDVDGGVTRGLRLGVWREYRAAHQGVEGPSIIGLNRAIDMFRRMDFATSASQTQRLSADA